MIDGICQPTTLDNSELFPTNRSELIAFFWKILNFFCFCQESFDKIYTKVVCDIELKENWGQFINRVIKCAKSYETGNFWQFSFDSKLPFDTQIIFW